MNNFLELMSETRGNYGRLFQHLLMWHWNLKTTMKSARGLSRIYKVYNDLLTKHPVKVQSIQTAMLCGTGDIIAQTAIEKKKLSEFDGPTLRMWFGLLDTKVKGSHYAVVAQKVLLDQCIMAPFLLLLTLSVLNICSGKSLAEVKEKLGADYGSILITNYKVWPAVQLINFGFVPVNFQVPVTQVVGVGWNTYLSWKAHRPPQKPAVE
ncbi:protein Mpv17-like isoform X3 [Schistocerca serialis cubense]|uniref:protein Mpv17-like isoform X3 n=1 Tax=Schistocerca serialis cubense TaxID=2023355 RepID=UPI00214DFAAC|nr:protein Mpv17-like isoform X3 [Schistocerca serialis cubense]